MESKNAGAATRLPSSRDGQAERSHVLIIDDHAVFAETLAMAIDSQDDMRCSGIAASVDTAVELLLDHPADVILIDIQLPDMDGIEGTRRLRELSPDSRVVVLTAHKDVELIADAAAAGACGFISKEGPLRELLRAIRSGSNGGMIVEPSSLLEVLARVRESTPEADSGPSYSSLTKREHQVLTLMAQGLDARAIAQQLEVSIHTTRGHVRNILAKLDVHSQLEAVVLASRQGLLTV